MEIILDASALLAFLHNEPGSDAVQKSLDHAIVSTINWAEVLQKSVSKNVDITGMQEDFSEIGVTFVPFTSQQAEIAAHLWNQTREYGLSLADRACLALAIDYNLPVLTADRVWGELDSTLNLNIQLLR